VVGSSANLHVSHSLAQSMVYDTNFTDTLLDGQAFARTFVSMSLLKVVAPLLGRTVRTLEPGTNVPSSILHNASQLLIDA